MSTSDDPLPVPWRTKRAIAGAAAALASVFSCVLAVPAAASPQPKYSLSVVEGETTQPEDVIAHTSASAEHAGEVVVSIVRGGITVYRDSGSSGAWLSQVPQVGDVVTLESPAGRLIGSEVYDGLPSIDPTVCASSVNFSGTRSAGETVEGGYFSVSPRPYFRRTSSGQAQVTLLSGTSFGGNFLTSLMLGETVFASESLETSLPGGAVFTYSSENDRPVGACPPPPPSPPPPPPPPPPPSPLLQGSILKLSHTTIRALLKSGWRDVVGINLPGTVTQDLYLVGGRIPAYATSTHRKPAALLLARATATAKTAGTVTLVLRATKRGRAKLRSARSVHVVLLTTLRSATGVKLVLGRRSVTLHR